MAISGKSFFAAAAVAAGLYRLAPTAREKYSYMLSTRRALSMKAGAVNAGSACNCAADSTGSAESAGNSAGDGAFGAIEEKKVIYLTFDDGPGEHTMELLDLLEEYDVKASFFVVTEFVEKYPEAVIRMKDDGHLVGLHSWRHRSALLASGGFTKESFSRSMKTLKKMGISPKLYRAPWGEINRETIRQTDKLGMERVYWTVMAEDWRGGQPAKVTAGKLLARTGPEDVICIHDGRGRNDAPARTVEALRMVLPIWKKEGYEFMTLDHRFCPGRE